MKKLIFSFFCFTLFFTVKNVYAFDSSNYRDRGLCGNFEVAGFHSDGYIDTVECFDSLNEAQEFMRNNGADDLAILTWTSHGTKIIDANLALLDLTVNPEQLTYYYETDECNTRKYTYTANGPYYGDVDGGFLGAGYSDTYGVWTAHVRLANFTGWIKDETYEIVPITWVKSSSNYTINSESIRHNYVYRIQDDYRSAGSSVIGPKPEMLDEGTYYSFDGHYFYTSLKDMMKDYKNNTYEHAYNYNNVYYNYYMYLSNHTKTTYSSVNIDEYIRNNLGYYHDIYGDDVSENASRLYGSGTFFYYAQEKYGVNALMSLGLSRNETGNGRSYLAIMKNNGFGLNAVDSDPINGASWYASYADSILGYASHWATYGFNHPRDWRYFGPQFGDKWVGMNVKYASAAYWSEAMAANYYFIDRAFGLQDYNYYQLGVVKYRTDAYNEPSTSSRWMYEYPEAEDAVVILGEETRNGEKWYKVQSDLNFDSNYNEIYEGGNYNWNAVVYVKADAIKLINKAKNGYKSSNDITEYPNKNYEYNLYIEDGRVKPRVGQSTKETDYYYDSSLTSKTEAKLKKDRYVVIYAQATLNGNPVAYLVTNNYFYDQKEWVSADSIKQVDITLGKITVNTDYNAYSWVNYNMEDQEYSIIGGLHTWTYVPILDSTQVGDDTWYTVPVDLSSDDHIYGYTLARYSDFIWFDLTTPVSENIAPVINADNIEIWVDDNFDPKEGVTASDSEDGDLTSSISITNNTVDTTKPGTYEVTYEVADSKNKKTTKTIKVIVKENEAPIINAEDKTITVNTNFNPKDNVTAEDKEDGDLTNSIEVKSNNVQINKVGTYKVVYEVKDSREKTTTKEITVEVVSNREPIINAENKQVLLNSEFDPKEGVTAQDPEDGDLTSSITVTKNTVNTSTKGSYEVTYKVTDSSNNTVEKTITVEVVDYQEKDAEFYLDELVWNNTTKKFDIKGYYIIQNIDNIDKSYKILAINKSNNKESYIDISKWTDDIPYDIGVENGYNYSDSWFKSEIDFSSLENGDYNLYILAYSKNYYSKVLLNNIFSSTITRRAQDSNKGYTLKVQLKSRTKEIELYVRDSVYSIGTTPTNRNLTNGYEDVSFNDNNLYLLGYSYDTGGVYDKKEEVIHRLIIENQLTYEQTVFDLDNVEGAFKIETADGKDKTYAWYEKEIDISSLEKGNYALYIYTKTSNAENYDELPDTLKMINIQKTISNKKYTIKYNRDRKNRIEITVE